MTSYLITDDELDMLYGQPWSAQLAYFRAIRPYMDYTTRIVGLKRRISRRSIREELEVPEQRGRHCDEQATITMDGVRHALEVLKKCGVIEQLPYDKQLVFRLPCAHKDRSVSRMSPRSAPDEHPTMSTRTDTQQKPNKSSTSSEMSPRMSPRSTPETWEGMSPLHPVSGKIKDKKPYTEADASVSAPHGVSRDQIPSPIEPQRQAPLLPPVALTNTAPPREPRAKVAKPRVSTAPVWAAYSAAYRERYGVTPVRNSTINGQLAHLVRRLGDEAPAVARYYLDLEDPYYRREGHSVGALLKHCEQLRTLWKRAEQRRVSPSAALNPDDVVIAL